jgi:hypothetical protein
MTWLWVVFGALVVLVEGAVEALIDIVSSIDTDD